MLEHDNTQAAISSLFSKDFSDSVKNVHNFTFSPKKILFLSAKISDDLF